MGRKVVIFDFDGTIVDTWGFCYEINTRIFPGMSEDEYRNILVTSIFDKSRNSLLNKYRIVDSISFNKEYLKNIFHARMFNGMKDMLTELNKDHYLVINSSSRTENILHYLKLRGLLHEFDLVLGCDVDQSKAKKFKMILEKYNVSQRDCIFITDTVSDIREAKECRVRSIAVTWGFHTREMLKKEKPFSVVDNVTELEKSINDFFASSIKNRYYSGRLKRAH